MAAGVETESYHPPACPSVPSLTRAWPKWMGLHPDIAESDSLLTFVYAGSDPRKVAIPAYAAPLRKPDCSARACQGADRGFPLSIRFKACKTDPSVATHHSAGNSRCLVTREKQRRPLK
jgi:hypothetical protein